MIKDNRILLDTHILVWLLCDPKLLNSHILNDILYNSRVIVYVSVVSLQEIVILQHLKKIELKINLQKILREISDKNIRILDVKSEHIETLENLSYPIIGGKTHEDPFDRLLISQSISEHITLISADKKFPFYKDKDFYLVEN
jgi:PIN domain nuclease of toxin-antitoxin system